MTLREYFDPNAIRLCVFRAAELQIVIGNMVARSKTSGGVSIRPAPASQDEKDESALPRPAKSIGSKRRTRRPA